MFLYVMVKVTHAVLEQMVVKAVKGFKTVTVKLWHGSVNSEINLLHYVNEQLNMFLHEILYSKSI